jgi:hypothetical protein
MKEEEMSTDKPSNYDIVDNVWPEGLDIVSRFASLQKELIKLPGDIDRSGIYLWVKDSRGQGIIAKISYQDIDDAVDAMNILGDNPE